VNLAQSKPQIKASDLYLIVRDLHKEMSVETFVEEVRSLANERRLALQESVPRGISFFKFLWRWQVSLWFDIVVGILALMVVTIYLLPNTYPLVVVRWVAGSIVLLFVPGFVTVKLLLPKEELDDLERLALSLGVSVALVPLVGLILNFTPWGIGLDSIVVSLTFYAVAMALGAAWRKYTILRSGQSC